MDKCTFTSLNNNSFNVKNKTVLGHNQKAINIVLSSILFSLSKNTELKQNVCCIISPMSESVLAIDLHDITNSIPENPEVGVQLLEWQAPMHLHVGQCVQV